MIKIKCLICNKFFFIKPSRKNTAKYCSSNCYGKSKIGKPNFYCLGKSRSKETIKKMRKGMEKYWHIHSHPCKNKKLPQFSGENSSNWNGGKTISRGYVWLRKPNHPHAHNGYIKEASFMVEKYLGRYLLPGEVVHHRSKKDDNRPHMLMVFSNNSAHMRFHHNPSNVKPDEIIFDGSKL